MRIERVVRRLLPVGIAALVAVATYLQACGFSAIVSRALASWAPPGADIEHREASSASRSEHLTSAAALLARNPFQSERLSPEPTQGARGARCEGVLVKLVASSADPEWSFAAIATDGKTTLRRRGDLAGHFRVERIDSDSVWLVDETGRRCAAASGRDGALADAMAERGSQPAGIRRLGDTEYEIDRTLVDRLLENGSAIAKGVRIIPERRAGADAGLRLVRIPPESMLSQVGLRTGDVVSRVNDYDITNPRGALEAYANLRSAASLTVHMERDGKPTALTLHVR